MKNKLILSLVSGVLLTSMYANADEEIVPLDMALGHWITSTELEQSPMINQMLANVPEAQRETILKMMESSIESAARVEQCVTADSFEDMEERMRSAFAGAKGDNQCELNVTKSTSKEFVGEMVCAAQGEPMRINTKVINSKRHESVVVTNLAGMGENVIKSTGEWQSATCPDGVEAM